MCFVVAKLHIKTWDNLLLNLLKSKNSSTKSKSSALSNWKQANKRIFIATNKQKGNIRIKRCGRGHKVDKKLLSSLRHLQ